jgi:hypothetical protein
MNHPQAPPITPCPDSDFAYDCKLFMDVHHRITEDISDEIDEYTLCLKLDPQTGHRHWVQNGNNFTNFLIHSIQVVSTLIRSERYCCRLR